MSDSQREGRLANLSGAVLIGGASTRMGRDKATLEIGGVPFAAVLAERLSRIFEDVMLVGGAPPPAAPGRAVPDCGGPRCALRGLVSALDAARTERVLVVATDVPLVAPALLLALVAWPEADAVVPRDADHAHPLCAVYRRDAVLAVARQRLAEGRLALSGVLDAVDTRYVEADALAQIDPGGRSLTNVNTAEELAALGAHPAVPSLFE
jgi:molybdopterin-guanine dinucleotide biosynthesis protein A